MTVPTIRSRSGHSETMTLSQSRCGDIKGAALAVINASSDTLKVEFTEVALSQSATLNGGGNTVTLTNVADNRISDAFTVNGDNNTVTKAAGTAGAQITGITVTGTGEVIKADSTTITLDAGLVVPPTPSLTTTTPSPLTE